MKKHLGTIGGFLLGAGSAMIVEILKSPAPASPVVTAVAAVEVLVGVTLIALHSRS
jgi:xanthosine utilization system XapX-like protein